MAIIATIKAIITRLLFGAHGFIAIWQVASNKDNFMYWYLCSPIGLLFLEGLFTLAIKKNQEWRWFCPSVFIYLSSVVPAIWLLELDKIEQRQRVQKERTLFYNSTSLNADFKKLDKFFGVNIKLPDIQVDQSTWITLIEQFLMLILIVGRWMLPKGDLTRDQLSQLLLVYIGTAADIIEFFDSYKENTIANEPLLVFLTLGIWSWSLLQFTIVLSATRSRKPRGGGNSNQDTESNTCCGGCCCTIDVWGIVLNIVLQDAPFLAFRLLIIIHYKIISYMNVFFTCKNTLVILLQLYRLYVVHTENRKTKKEGKKLERKRMEHRSRTDLSEFGGDVYIISSNAKHERRRRQRNVVSDISDEEYQTRPKKKFNSKKDTGYSTASSHTSKSHDEHYKVHPTKKSTKSHRSNDVKLKRNKHDKSEADKRKDPKTKSKLKEKSRKNRRDTGDESPKKSKQRNNKELDVFTEESDTSQSDRYETVNETKRHRKKRPASTSSYSSE